jgi:hypothetical protein
VFLIFFNLNNIGDLMKKMLVILLVSIFLMNGCLQFLAPAQEKYAGELKDCGWDKDCFVQAYHNDCEKVKGNLLFSEQENTKLYGELHGMVNGSCKIYIQLVDSDNILAKTSSGSDMTCYLNDDEINSLVLNFSPSKLRCEGSLFEGLKLAFPEN